MQTATLEGWKQVNGRLSANIFDHSSKSVPDGSGIIIPVNQTHALKPGATITTVTTKFTLGSKANG